MLIYCPDSVLCSENHSVYFRRIVRFLFGNLFGLFSKDYVEVGCYGATAKGYGAQGIGDAQAHRGYPRYADELRCHTAVCEHIQHGGQLAYPASGGGCLLSQVPISW